MTESDNEVNEVGAVELSSNTRPSVLPESVIVAIDSLESLNDLPLTDHIERYRQIHTGLQDVLSGIEGV